MKPAFSHAPLPLEAWGDALVSVDDVLAFTEPTTRAWAVVVGVVDGLRLQRGLAEFEQAITRIEEHVADWPDGVRTCPKAWWGDLLNDPCAPHLRLVRRIDLDASKFGYNAGQAARWIQALAASPAVSRITSVYLYHFGKQRAFLAALEALFRAADTKHVQIVGKGNTPEAIRKHLEAAGLFPKPRPWKALPPFSGSLDDAHVTLEIESVEALAAALQRTDLEHVVSLDVDLQSHAWGEIPKLGDVTPAQLPNLRWLRVDDRGGHGAVEQLFTWLSQARPIAMPLYVQSPALRLRLAHEGVLERAFHASLWVSHQTDLDALRELLGSGRVRCSLLYAEALREEDTLCFDNSRMRGRYGAPLMGTREIVSSMHPTLKAAIRGLAWPLAEDDRERLAEVFEALPDLGLWEPHCGFWHPGSAEASLASRDALITALSKIEAARGLGLITPDRYLSNQFKLPKLKATQRKRLDKGVGPSGAAWIVEDSHNPPWFF